MKTDSSQVTWGKKAAPLCNLHLRNFLTGKVLSQVSTLSIKNAIWKITKEVSLFAGYENAENRNDFVQ